jgi:hypothetical protein
MYILYVVQTVERIIFGDKLEEIIIVKSGGKVRYKILQIIGINARLTQTSIVGHNKTLSVQIKSIE